MFLHRILIITILRSWDSQTYYRMWTTIPSKQRSRPGPVPTFYWIFRQGDDPTSALFVALRPFPRGTVWGVGETLKVGCCRPGTGKFRVGGGLGNRGALIISCSLSGPVLLISGERRVTLGCRAHPLRSIRILIWAPPQIWGVWLSFVGDAWKLHLVGKSYC